MFSDEKKRSNYKSSYPVSATNFDVDFVSTRHHQPSKI